MLETFTAVESALEATVDATDVAEPVLRRDAASLGRATDGAEGGFKLMRAAS